MAHLFLLYSCQTDTPSTVEQQKPIEPDSAQFVVDMTIEAYGGLRDELILGFDFRKFRIQIKEKLGAYTYSRSFVSESGDSIKDVLTNSGLTRYVNGSEEELPEERKQAFSNSVNSVVYFTLLPFKLKDPAVILNYEGVQSVGSKKYLGIRVGFKEEGGGEDFDDEFFYWFDIQNYSMDYFAYKYSTSGGGIRFRQSIKKHEVENGLILQDYINYKTDSLSIDLSNLPDLMLSEKLIELSRIEIENVGSN